MMKIIVVLLLSTAVLAVTVEHLFSKNNQLTASTGTEINDTRVVLSRKHQVSGVDTRLSGFLDLHSPLTNLNADKQLTSSDHGKESSTAHMDALMEAKNAELAPSVVADLLYRCGENGTYTACAEYLWQIPDLGIKDLVLPRLLREVYYMGKPCQTKQMPIKSSKPMMNKEFMYQCRWIDSTKLRDAVTPSYLKELQEYCLLPQTGASFWAMVGDSVLTKLSAPTIVKSREITTRCGTLMPLHYLRHWAGVTFEVMVPWQDKIDSFVWRGTTSGTGMRYDYVSVLGKKYNVKFDKFCQHKEHWITKDTNGTALQKKDLMRYKYVLSLEGNDVSTSLKWLLAQNSVVVMPTPTKESWLMEGMLVPWVHYVPLEDPCKADKLLLWLRSHEEECLKIVQNANQRMRVIMEGQDWKLLKTQLMHRVSTRSRAS